MIATRQEMKMWRKRERSRGATSVSWLLQVFAAAVLVTCFAASASQATDYSALRNDERVERELRAASVAFLLVEGCSALEFRKFTVFIKAMSLNNHAMDLGYSSEEVKDYVASPTEQHRFRQQAASILLEKGAELGKQSSYCAIGHEEIGRGTLVGSLLYARKK